MNLIYPTRDEIIEFFRSHSGFHTVYRISELLISNHHSNIQDVEWKHVLKILHQLKSEGYLLIKNEGENIHEEQFSSTPDRLEKFLENSSKVKNYFDNKNENLKGEVHFDYSSNDGLYCIGNGDMTFGIHFSGASQQAIYVYNDDSSLISLSLIKGATGFDDVNLNRNYDGTSRTRCPEVGQIVLLKNINYQFALIKILGIKMESRGDVHDDVHFSYKIIGKVRDDLIIDKEMSRQQNFIDDLLSEIDSVYDLARQELLEAIKLEELETKIRLELKTYIETLSDEIILLKFKKMDGGMRNILKPGFHNFKTAESKLGKWRDFLQDLNNLIEKPIGAEKVKTIKNRLKTEGLFIESRSQDEDLHLLIGKRDGTAGKAHVIIDGKTAEIRVEDNQQEPTDLILKVESILTLKDGKRVKVTREAIEELSSNEP